MLILIPIFFDVSYLTAALVLLQFLIGVVQELTVAWLTEHLDSLPSNLPFEVIIKFPVYSSCLFPHNSRGFLKYR